MPRSTYGDPAASRLARLKAYDAAAGSDAKGALSEERLALARERFADSQNRDARDFEFKQAESQGRADHYQRVGEVKDQLLQQKNTALELAKAHADLAEQEKATKAARDLSIVRDATGFLKDAAGMNPAKPEFDYQLQKLYAGYPLAGAHPSVEKWQAYHLPLREKFVTEEIARRKPADPGDKTVVMDESGAVKSTTIKQPIPSGVDAATLAQHDALETTINANSGKAQDPAKIAQLNSLKAKLGFAPIVPQEAGAASVAAPVTQPSGSGIVPPTTPPVATAAATPDPNDQAAVAWAAANPNDPRAQKIKQLHGVQ